MTSEQLLSTLGNFSGLFGFALFGASIVTHIISPEFERELVVTFVLASGLLFVNLIIIVRKVFVPQ